MQVETCLVLLTCVGVSGGNALVAHLPACLDQVWTYRYHGARSADMMAAEILSLTQYSGQPLCKSLGLPLMVIQWLLQFLPLHFHSRKKEKGVCQLRIPHFIS